jgi:hypothetical protein
VRDHCPQRRVAVDRALRLGPQGQGIDLLQPRLDERREHVLFAGEVVVERRLRHGEPLGDVADRRPGVAALGEQLTRRLEDPALGDPPGSSQRS